MPKTKKGKNAGKKAKEKSNAVKKEKVKIDKTFGMKNKKGSRNQRYVENYRKSQDQGGGRGRGMSRRKQKEMEAFAEQQMMGTFVGRVGGVSKAKAASLEAKAAKAEAKEAENNKVKVCQFFAKGLCRRGNKCKYSHDLALLQKATKEDNLINVYEDKREKSMEDMTQEELEKLVESKDTKRPNQTDIICKYFLEALEKQQYGHRWKCPNGDECIYRHKLPYGYILQAKGANADENNEETLEEGLERMRREVAQKGNLTPVTPETFAEWKTTWIRREAEEKAKAAKKAAKSRGGHRQLSGKQLFSFDPTLFKTSDDTVDLTAQLDALRHKDDVKESDGLDERPDLDTIEEEVEPAAQASEPPEVFDASLFEDDILPDDDILPEEDEPKIIEKKKKKKKKDKDGGESSKKKKKKKKKDIIKGDPTKSNKPVPFPGYTSSSDSSPEKSKHSVTQNVTIGDAKLFQDAGDLPDF